MSDDKTPEPVNPEDLPTETGQDRTGTTDDDAHLEEVDPAEVERTDKFMNKLGGNFTLFLEGLDGSTMVAHGDLHPLSADELRAALWAVDVNRDPIPDADRMVAEVVAKLKAREGTTQLLQAVREENRNMQHRRKAAYTGAFWFLAGSFVAGVGIVLKDIFRRR